MLTPCLKVLYSKKRMDFSSFSNLDNWSYKLLHESVDFYQWRPESMNKVYDKTLYVRTIMVLICHYHKGAITELGEVSVGFAKLET